MQYERCYETFYRWVVAGHIKVEGTHSSNEWGPADALFLNTLGFGPIGNDAIGLMIEQAHGLSMRLKASELDLDWMESPHGLALFKMKMAQHEKA